MRAEDSGQAAQPRPLDRRREMSASVWWTLLGTAANSAGTWLVIVILARSSGATEVGTYAMVLALTAPVLSFTGLQLRNLLASDARRHYSFSEYVRLTLVGSVVGVVVCVLIALAVGEALRGWSVFAAVCIMRTADLFSDIYFGLWQRQERMSVIGIGRLLQTVVSIAFVGAAALIGGGALTAAIGAALGSVTLLAFLHFRTVGDEEMRDAATATSTAASWRRLVTLATEGVPLGIILLLGALQFNVPRYFIEIHAGKAGLGLFASASQLTTAGNIFVGALAGAALPRLARWSTTDDAAFMALTRKLVLCGVGLAAAGIAASALIGRQVLVLVYRPEFAAAERILIVLSMAAGLGFVASFLGWALTASRIIAIQPVLLTVTLAVLVAACAALTPRYGAVGASWALVAGSAVQAIGAAAALLRSRASRRRIRGAAPHIEVAP